MRQGFRVFSQHPLGFSGLFAGFLFGVLLLTIVPFVGPLLLLVALPLVTLGFMVATRRAMAGGAPTPAAFIEPLRQGRSRNTAMLQLGLMYAAATFGIATVSDWLDGGALDAAVGAMVGAGTDPAATAERLATSELEFALLLRLSLAALLSVPFWHAPALVHWGGQGAAQALFSSTLAVWRNLGAFAVYGLSFAAVVLGFALVVTLLFGMLGQPKWIALALMPASLLFSTAFYASLWFTFADCFGTVGGDDAPADPDPVTSDTP
jgi:hypothetical protein